MVAARGSVVVSDSICGRVCCFVDDCMCLCLVEGEVDFLSVVLDCVFVEVADCKGDVFGCVCRDRKEWSFA